MKKIYIVRLTPEERVELEKLVSAGKARAWKLMHAHILLEADADGTNWADDQISEALSIVRATVERVRKAFVEKRVAGFTQSQTAQQEYTREVGW